MHPSIIFRNKFVYDWNINGDEDFSGGDFLDYMLRPEAFNADLHRHTSDQFYGFEEFMDSEEISDGLFSSDCDLMNKTQVNKIREHEKRSRENGCPKYIGVMSFDNNYLRNNNILVGKHLNVQKLKEVSRKGMNALIETSDKLEADNCYWVASIHTNAKHIHVHYQLLEYERINDRRKLDVINKDKIEVKAFRKLKSTVMYGIDHDKTTERLTTFEREVLQKNIAYSFASSISQIDDLIKKLPENRGWQYNRFSKAMKNQIDSVVRSLIRSDESINADFTEYIRQLDEASLLFKRRYGKRSHWAEYKMNRLHGKIGADGKRKDGFYSRVGNSLLNLCKEYQKTGKIDLSGLDNSQEFIRQDIIDSRIGENESLLPDKDSFDEKNAHLSNIENEIGAPMDITLQLLDDAGNEIEIENEVYDQFSPVDETEEGENADLSNEKNDKTAYSAGMRCLFKGDNRKAYHYLKLSADMGNSDAQFYAGKLLLDNGSKADEQTAVKLLVEADKQGCEKACFLLGKYYLRSTEKSSRKNAEKFLYRSAVDYNNSYAQYYLGKFYLEKGKVNKAEMFFKMSSENQNSIGQLAYGLLLCKQGKSAVGREWLKRSAKNGNKFAARLFKGNKNIPLCYQLRILSRNQSVMLGKVSGMLKSSISEERAKTQRLMREFEREQDQKLMQEQEKSVSGKIYY